MSQEIRQTIENHLDELDELKTVEV